jgi:hypothetical protein
MGWKLTMGCMTVAVVLLSATKASALLIEKTADRHDDPLELTYFYPYPTTYDFVDERFAFDDDPLEAFVQEPYFMPVVVRRHDVKRSMVEPRKSFVYEMVRSTDSI